MKDLKNISQVKDKDIIATEISAIEADPIYLVKQPFLSIKTKAGELLKLRLNSSQRKLLTKIMKLRKEKKRVRLWLLKYRQGGMCLAPDTKILTSDLCWVNIDDISIGQQILAVDEGVLGNGKGKSRMMKLGVVEQKRDVTKGAFKITMEDGRILVATGEHRFLSRKRNGVETQWRMVKDMKQGDVIRHLTNPWDIPNYEDGWFGGIIDGEGSVRRTKRSGYDLKITQQPGVVCSRIREYLINNKYTFQEKIDTRPAKEGGKFGSKPINMFFISRMDELMRMIGKTRPSRLINKLWWQNKNLPCRGRGNEAWIKIISIESMGKKRMVDLQTSTKTFIAEGLVSHNSTLIEALIYSLTSQNENRNSLIMADEKDKSDYLFQMSKLYHEELKKTEPYLAPELKKSNAKSLEFEGTRSQIIIETAENPDAARAFTYQYVHLCLHPDTDVIVNDCRIKKIKDVCVGDKVVTHMGRVAIVKGVSTSKTADICGNKKLVSIRVSGSSQFPIQCTPNHKIFVRDRRGNVARKDGRGEWREARDIKKGEMLGIPLKIAYPKKDNGTHTFSLGYVFGVYLAEGNIFYNKGKKPAGFQLTMGQGEDPILDSVSSYIKNSISSYSFRARKNSKTICGVYYGSKFARYLLSELGEKDNKRIPDKFRYYPKDFIRGLIKGYLDGDGHIPDDKEEIRVSSIRPQILIQLRDLLLGYRIGYSSLDYRNAGYHYGRNCKAIWTLRMHGTTSRKLREFLGYKAVPRHNGYKIRQDWRMGRRHCWVSVESISETESENVCDLVLDHTDHSFRTINGVAVHNSEVAFFSNFKKVMDGLNQSVPDFWDTIVIGETTANGMNEFYNEWIRAIEGKTDWVPMFFAWFEMEEYAMPLENGQLYPLNGIKFDADTSVQKFEQDEAELKQEFGLTDEQLNWRRWAIVNKCGGDLNVFRTEYPATWQEAFAMSGSLFFDRRGLARQLEKRPVMVGELFYENIKYEFREFEHGRIKVYEKPDSSEEYIVASDASEAIGSDEAAITVLNKRLNTTAALVAGQHTPEEIAEMNIALGNWYHQAMVAPENKGYGYMVCQLVYQKYGKIYKRLITKSGEAKPVEELGFNTNTITRPQMLAQMNEEIRNGSTELYAKELIDECRTFVIKKDKAGNVTKVEAQDGFQDGLVICYDEKTRVLTSSGWKYVKDIKDNELIPSMNIKTEKVEMVRNLKTIIKWHEGRMIRFVGKSIDLMVTPEHSVIAGLSCGHNEFKPYEFIPAEQLVGKRFRFIKTAQWGGEHIGNWIIPAYSVHKKICVTKRNNKGQIVCCEGHRYVKEEKRLPIVPFLQMVGFYIAEGSGNKNRLAFSQMEFSKGYRPFKECLDNLGVNYKVQKGYGFIVNDTQIASYIKSFIPGYCYEKRIPRKILELHPSLLKYLFDFMMLGDGCDGRVYITTSYGLKDDFIELVNRLGWSATYKAINKIGRQALNGTTRHLVYCISINKRDIKPRINFDEYYGKQVYSEPFFGNVYCLQLEKHHTLLVERNGRTCWSGNCRAIAGMVRQQYPYKLPQKGERNIKQKRAVEEAHKPIMTF